MTSTARRRADPAKVFLHAALLLCGVALTWLCAAIGLFWLTAPHGGPSRQRVAQWRVTELRDAVVIYQIERGRCPATRDDLIANRYINPRGLVDPWGTGIAFWCAADDAAATSAGPDRTFATWDDITRGP